MVRVPPIASIDKALSIYYNRMLLGTADIVELFGCSRSTAAKLKTVAKEQMQAENKMQFNARLVDTASAFRAWGIDIKQVESYKKKKEMYGI